MSISAEDVQHVASLARLDVGCDRITALVSEMNRILDYVGMLQHVEMRPMSVEQGAPATISSLRPDIADSVKLERSIADFAPAERDGFLLVPRLASHA